MPDTKLLKSQLEGLLMLERDANARITEYLRLCASDLGLDIEKVVYNRETRSFIEPQAQALQASTTASAEQVALPQEASATASLTVKA
jgi:hypothetical protein